MEITMVLNLPRDAVSVPVSRQVLDACLETLGVTAETRGDIALALSEACGNVIQHAGPGDEYEVQIHAGKRRCVIEVVNTSQGSAPDGLAVASEPVSVTAEQGRGLRIIDAVADNVELTSSARQGTTVHFEKTLDWVPGAPGQHLFTAGAEA
jgi:serine/threonine-protein kinase RsbW